MAGTHEYDSTLGAMFLGNLAAAIFYGITCVQIYIYYRKKYKDSLTFKLLIFFLSCLDTLQLAFISHGSYYYLVSNFDNISAIESPTWTILLHIYATTINDTIIRGIFGRRVWLISRRNHGLAGCIAATTSLTFVTALMFASKAFIVGTFKHFSEISYLLYAAFASGVVADVLIAASLCISLSRSRTGFKKVTRSESVINLIMLYTINTCLLTTFCSAACFVTYAIWPTALVFLGIYYLLGKLYLNSLLATLHSREGLLEKLNDVVLSDIVLNKDQSMKPLSKLKFAAFEETNGASLQGGNHVPLSQK